MGTKKWLTLAISSVVAISCLATTTAGASAQNSNVHNLSSGDGRGADPLTLYRQAGINQEQEKDITTLLKAFETQMLDKGNTMMSLIQEMKSISHQTDIDEQVAIAKQTEINKLNADMAIERVKLLCSIRKVLTAEQRQKLIKLL